MRYLPVVVLPFLGILSAVCFRGVHEVPAAERFRHPTDYSVSADSGRLLAQRHCQGCHLLPDPSLIDKKTWTGSVLPNMALRLGIREAGTDPYADVPEAEAQAMRALDVYPGKPALSASAWNQLVSYYEREAPDAPIPSQEAVAVDNRLHRFKVQSLTLGGEAVPKTTLLKYDSTGGKLYVGDDHHSLFALDKEFNLTNGWRLDSAPTDIDFPGHAPPRLLTIGVLPPSDQKLGKLFSMGGQNEPGPAGIVGLARPVQFASADLNADGREDGVVCEFGNHGGRLCWYENFDQRKEHILSPLPGARRVEIRDLNNDQKPDLVVLMAQAREGVSIYYNQGEGQFHEKKVLQFQPAFGASYLETADFNADGYLDLLLANGDNWDYSPVNKNYHGVRVYLNDRRDNYTEAYFFPLYGASKALARDFDNDGDLDIAVTSFYADLDRPEQGFVYLENQGKMNFKAFSTPEAAAGKWLTMEAADIDRDGDTDLVLGSYFQSLGELTQLISRGITEFPQLLILTNETVESPQKR